MMRFGCGATAPAGQTKINPAGISRALSIVPWDYGRFVLAFCSAIAEYSGHARDHKILTAAARVHVLDHRRFCLHDPAGDYLFIAWRIPGRQISAASVDVLGTQDRADFAARLCSMQMYLLPKRNAPALPDSDTRFVGMFRSGFAGCSTIRGSVARCVCGCSAIQPT